MVKGSPTSARQLRELLVHRMASGRYPVGAQLPGTRELAAEVGANRNTVAKVYGELARDGLVQIVPGRGAFVVARVDATVGAEPLEQVARLLDEAISRARLFGIGREAMLRLAGERVSAAYDADVPRLVFVECNPYDAKQGASELGAQLGMAVQPVLVRDVERVAEIEPVDAVATSFFHLEEVDRLLAGRELPVIGINTLPDPTALHELARLPPGTRVGIVVANEAGVERFSGLVRTYCRAEIRALVSPGAEQLRELARWAGVLVSSLSCAPQVRATALDRPVITLSFHVDPQSVQYLRNRVPRRSEQVAAVPLASPEQADPESAGLGAG